MPFFLSFQVHLTVCLYFSSNFYPIPTTLTRPPHQTPTIEGTSTTPTATALFSFQSLADDKLPLERNRALDLISIKSPHWWSTRDPAGSLIGFVPANYVVASEALHAPRDCTFMLWSFRENTGPLSLSV